MIVSEITKIPTNLNLSKYAQQELFKVDKTRIENITRRMWELSDETGPFCLLGVTQESLIGSHKLWVLVSERLSFHQLRMMRAGLSSLLDIFPILEAWVEPDFAKGLRFVAFFGFKPIAVHPDFIIYEVRKWRY